MLQTPRRWTREHVGRAGSTCRCSWSLSDGCDKSQVKGTLCSLPRWPLSSPAGEPARAVCGCTRPRAEHRWAESLACGRPRRPDPALLSLQTQPLLLRASARGSRHLIAFPSLLAPFLTPRDSFLPFAAFSTSGNNVWDGEACRGTPTTSPTPKCRIKPN